MRKSFYLSGIESPSSEHVLLFQLLNSAIDIVPAEFWTDLKGFDEAAEPRRLTGPEIEQLKKRGYLVDESLEQELELNKRVLHMAASAERERCEVKLRFPQRRGDSALIASSGIEEVVSLARSIAGDTGPIVVRAEITSKEIEPQIFEDLLRSAPAYDLVVIPEVTVAGLGALLPWRNNRGFEEVLLASDSTSLPTDILEIAERIIGFFEEQVTIFWKCQIDGMLPEQLRAIRGICETVRRRYKNFGVLLVSEHSSKMLHPGTSESAMPAWPVLRPENESLLLTLNRCIWRPDLVNYNPFFRRAPSILAFDLDSSDLVFQPAGAAEAIAGFDAIRRAAENRRAGINGGIYLDKVSRSSECVSCKFSLFCGRDWIGDYGYETMERCSSMLEKRMGQTLPALFFNLRGNWAPPKEKE